MKQELKILAKKIIRRRPTPRVHPDKLELIDFACRRLNMSSFADLGGIWNVDGAYTFYAMEHHHIRDAVMVDTDLTQDFLIRQKRHAGLRVIEGNFGDPGVLDRIGKVDGLFFFDTLLHQVRPNWDDVLKMYAGLTRIFIVFNQQYTNLLSTTRLLDLGRDEYFRNVPHTPDEEPYKTCFQNLEAIHPQHARPYRDIHNIWQWGIIDADLIGCARDLGFGLQFFKNCGQFGRLRNVENHAFVFSKSRAIAPL